ncbi:MAG TPA: sugar phosphate isomerase/epimerase family protein [Spirochaetia bacterium]|nr:sugar phosphate isomerase/epimerase family protein [Spirochaetia bacterium]
MTVKNALITGFLSKTKDRFHDYNKEISLDEKLSMVSRMQGVDGVEVVYPYEVKEPSGFREMLSKYGLNIAAINVNVKAEPEFRNGGLTSTDPEIRAKAIRFIKEAKDFAKAAGANKVTCCPLGDGYEFNFHCDYTQMWHHLVESFGEAGSYLPEIPLFIEYKPSETRGRCFVDTGAKTLCLLNDIGIAKMGVTLDFGHSMYGNENPAEVVALLANSKYPYYVHINDNDARWDWDYMAGTKHLLDYIEFLYYLQELGYDDYLTSDTSPTRWDITETFEANARITNKLWNRLLEIDRKRLGALVASRDFIETWKFLESDIFKL